MIDEGGYVSVWVGGFSVLIFWVVEVFGNKVWRYM